MKALEKNHVNREQIGGMTTFGKMMKENEPSSKSGGAPSRTAPKKKSTISKRIENKQNTVKGLMKNQALVRFCFIIA